MNARRLLEALFGAYVALAVVPGGALVGRKTGGAFARPTVLVAAGVAVAVAVALAARTDDALAGSLASPAAVVGTVLAPLAYFPYMVVVLPPGSRAATVALVGLLAVVPGVCVSAGADLIRNRRLREGATEVGVVTVGGEGGDATDVAVTDHGLRVDDWLTAWDRFRGYRVTDGEIALVGDGWYRFGRRFDRGEIDDEDALTAALSEFLPRLDERGRVETPAGRAQAGD